MLDLEIEMAFSFLNWKLKNVFFHSGKVFEGQNILTDHQNLVKWTRKLIG